MDAADAILELETLLLNMPCLLTCLDPSQKPAAGLQQAGDWKPSPSWCQWQSKVLVCRSGSNGSDRQVGKLRHFWVCRVV